MPTPVHGVATKTRAILSLRHAARTRAKAFKACQRAGKVCVATPCTGVGYKVDMLPLNKPHSCAVFTLFGENGVTVSLKNS
jgi:hypothetical protein